MPLGEILKQDTFPKGLASTARRRMEFVILSAGANDAQSSTFHVQACFPGHGSRFVGQKNVRDEKTRHPTLATSGRSSPFA
jgi:hypothetical protein